MTVSLYLLSLGSSDGGDAAKRRWHGCRRTWQSRPRIRYSRCPVPRCRRWLCSRRHSICQRPCQYSVVPNIVIEQHFDSRFVARTPRSSQHCPHLFHEKPLLAQSIGRASHLRRLLPQFGRWSQLHLSRFGPQDVPRETSAVDAWDGWVSSACFVSAFGL